MPRVVSSQLTTLKGGGKRKARNASKKSDSVGQYASDAWSLAKRTAVGLNEIRKLINIESKIVQGTWTYTPDQTGTVQAMTLMAQGQDYINNRIGDSVKIQRIELKVKLLQSSSSTGTVIRYIVFRDLFNTGGGTATTANLLDSVNTAFAPLSPYNYLLRDRFAIVHDSLVDLSASGDACATIAVDEPHQGHIKFVGTGATTASAGPGGLYIAVVSDETANFPTVSTSWRVTFTDD